MVVIVIVIEAKFCNRPQACLLDEADSKHLQSKDTVCKLFNV